MITMIIAIVKQFCITIHLACTTEAISCLSAGNGREKEDLLVHQDKRELMAFL
jgi:hypothetical protein